MDDGLLNVYPDALPLSSREQPIFSARAHVFQIDPATKRNWLPASKHAATVSFFYDEGRNVYRIISVGGTKVSVWLEVRGSIGCRGAPTWTLVLFKSKPREDFEWAPSCLLCDVQAIINSTITPNMTFTKTSQKFGQWADSRANTVYGLGFSTEQQLQQVVVALWGVIRRKASIRT